MRLKWVWIAVAALLVILAGFGLKTVYDAGEFKDIVPHSPGPGQQVPGLLGSEDITIDPETGLAFISSVDFRALSQGGALPRGAIYTYDLNSEASHLKKAHDDLPFEFQPHGLGLQVSGDGRRTLMVVNHRPSGHYVEIFDEVDRRLIHRRSVKGDLMHSPNDVIPLGPDRFYVTNDHGSTSNLGRNIEDYLGLSRAYVLYYDGTKFQVAAQGLGYANGINLSPDGRRVYVAQTRGRKLSVYLRGQDDGLTLETEIDLGTGVDNIELDDQGRLLIGAHPKMLTFIRYAKDQAQPSPSQILRITPGPNGDYQVEEIYLGDGRELSGSSVGAVWNGRLLIGSVFDDRFLIVPFSN